MDNEIQHPGTIIQIKNDVVYVQIEQTSSCVSCQAKGICSAADKADKTIEISLINHSFKLGDKVLVVEKRSLGFKAVLYAYVIPLIIVFITLLVLVSLQIDDVFAGATALLVLIPYYVIFSFFKDKLKKVFVFTIKKTDNDDLNCICE